MHEMKMEFSNSFVPVFIKYDFTSENYGRNVAKDWIECRLNVKPASSPSYRYIEIAIYPNGYNEMMPHFVLDIDLKHCRIGPVQSRSRANVFGLVWWPTPKTTTMTAVPSNRKKCRMFIGLANKTMAHNFGKYFRELLKLFHLYGNCENDAIETKVLSKNVNSSVCNEAEQMAGNDDNPTTTATANDRKSSIEIMRVETVAAASTSADDASNNDEDVVVLRPKLANQPNCRLARSLATISGLFKSHRDDANDKNKNSNDDDDDDDVSAVATNASTDRPASMSSLPSPCATSPCGMTKCAQKKSKRTIWNLFKLKKNVPHDAAPTFQRFAEPLNMERLSLSRGDIDSEYTNAEWYDLNKDEMSAFEARVPIIINKFNNYNQIINEPAILWPQHLPPLASCNAASTINLFEMDADANTVQPSSRPASASSLDGSISSTDSNGYAIMQPIFMKKYNQPIKSPILIDDITKSMNGHHNDHLNDSLYNLSSGFGSDSSDSSGNNSPTQQKSQTFETEMSPATSDFFSDSSHSKAQQKPSKTHRLRIKSRKLFGMLYRSHSATPVNGNVTPTPQNKSPTEC